MKQLIKNKDYLQEKQTYDVNFFEKSTQKYFYSEKFTPVLPYIIYGGSTVEKIIDLNRSDENNNKIHSPNDMISEIQKGKTVKSIMTNFFSKVVFNHKAKIRKRIEYLLDDVEDKGNFIHSLKEFFIFIINIKNITYPNIGLNPDSQIQCEWEKNNHILIVLFKSNDMVEYALITRLEGKEETWSTGYEHYNEFIETSMNNKKFMEILNE